MKKKDKLLIAPLLAASLFFGGTAASGAGIGLAVTGGEGQPLSQVTTVAGRGDLGEANGKAADSTFRAPWSLLALPDGSVLVADARSHLIRKLAASEVSTYAGITIGKDDYSYPIGGMIDGAAAAAVFQQPKGLAADQAGNVYVADTENHAIRKIGKNGEVTTLAGSGVLGSKDGRGKEAAFHTPQDVAVAADGTVYAADTLNHTIRKITADGTVTTLNALSERAVEVTPGQLVPAGDYADGPLKSAKFNEPAGLALDVKGNLYVSDSGNQVIRYIDFSSGTVTTVAGDSKTAYGKNEMYAAGDFADGESGTARFNFPKGIAVTADGGLLIADALNHSVRYLKDGVVRTVAGQKDNAGGSRDGTERYASFHHPADVAVLNDGTILVADAYNNKIRKIAFYDLPAGITSDGTIKVVYGGSPILFDAPPELSNGRTMVPVRAITEALGFQVTFNVDESTAERTVDLSKDDATIRLTIGQEELQRIARDATVTRLQMDVAPYIQSDLTYVPVRFFAEGLGLNVEWHEATSTVILRDNR